MADDTRKGMLVDMTIDGVDIEVTRVQLTLKRRIAKTQVETAGGGLKESVSWYGQAALENPGKLVPTQRVRYDIETTLGRTRGGWYDLVEAILARPGAHAVAAWKPVTVTWLGDGAADELWLPWVPSNHTLTPPGGFPVAEFDAVVWVGLQNEADALTYSTVSQATYDTGPTSGLVYGLDGGQLLKLDAAPAAGAYVYARVWPLFHMLEPGALVVSYEGARPGRESRSVVLMEA